MQIATGSKDVNGHFIIHLPQPLQPGQVLYATDGCFDPRLIGPFAVARPPASVPLLSLQLIGVLAAILGLVGSVGMRRLRLHQ